MFYDRIAGLGVRVDGYDLQYHERETTSLTRTTTTVSLHGSGETGRGEDVTYDEESHDRLHDSSEKFHLAGEYTLDEFSNRLSELDLFLGNEPNQAVFRNYRRWAFESAALDLALKQAGTNLADRLDREYSPVRFVVSTRLGEPPSGDRIFEWLDRNPDLEFKLDPTSEWSTDLVDQLAEMGAVRVLDLKGQYHGTEVDQPADPDLYQQVIDGFPNALIEDPALDEKTRPLFEEQKDRVTWDYPIRSVETIKRLPWEPTWLNIKPSRFGSVRSLFETLEYCTDHGIRMYGGGQFELDVGREHLHAIASLFYPDSPNDIAPKGYNDPEPESNLQSSPLDPPPKPHGLEW